MPAPRSEWVAVATRVVEEELIGSHRTSAESLADVNVAEVPEPLVARLTEVLRELRQIRQADALDFPRVSRSAWTAEWFPSYLRDLLGHGPYVWVGGPPIVSGSNASSAVEGALAVALLGQLEAFPDAPIDVILDVRERLAGPRTHFRAAMAQMADDLTNGGQAGEDIETLAAQIRRTTIDPALQEMHERLETLNARRTLLRLASDVRTITAGGAALSIAAGAGGGFAALGALVGGTLGAPALLAAIAKEAEYREALKADLRVRPYWMLHEAGQRLRSA